jgi:LmbE family N-acetylglucosaminyl deacetylase
MVTAESFFEGASRLPVASLEQIAGPRGIVVVAPHPDDETLGCGGLIALAHDAGKAIRIIVISDGCGSHPNSTSHPPNRLRDLRESETRAAVAALGLDPSALAFLRLADRYVPDEGEEAERAAREIAKAAAQIDASAVLATWRHDPHCDHQAAWRIAAMAGRMSPRGVALIAYPIWGWSLPPQTPLPLPAKGRRLAIKDVLERKQRAIASHRSQISSMVQNDPPALILTEETLARFAAPYETYLEPEA